MNILCSKFETNVPILLREILESFPNVAPMTVYRWIRTALDSSQLAKSRKGVYYLPTETRFGPSTLSDADIIRKKYLSENGKVYGYITGLALENRVGLSTQMPGTLEIVTNQEARRSRSIKPFGGYREIILKKPRVPVNSNNVATLEFLDLMTYAPIDRLEADERQALKTLAANVDRTKMLEYVKYYPRKTAVKILESEASGVFT